MPAIWVALMKTTIDIADDLFARSRKLARREGKTMRALVEEGLRLALQARSAEPAADFSFPTFGKGGLQAEFKAASWQALRDAIYATPGAPPP